MAVILSAQAAQAAPNAWSTVPGNSTFAGANWTAGATPGAPGATITSGDALYFGTSSLTALTNDKAAGDSYGFQFNAGANAFTITGNAINLTIVAGTFAIVQNSTVLQTINTDLTLAADRSIRLTGSGAATTYADNLALGG